MENKSTSNKDQSWQKSTLVKRLTKPLLQPGVISFKFADNILSGARNMIVPSPPVLMRIIQRKGMINDTGGGDLKIVNAQWVDNNKDRFLKNEEVDNDRLVKHIAQPKGSASELSSKLTSGDLQSKSEKSHLPIAKAVPQRLHSENIYKSKADANLQMKAVASEVATQGKATMSAGRANTVQRKQKAASFSGNRNFGDLQSKLEESQLPTVKAVPQALRSENIYESKSPAELQIKAIASEVAAQEKTTFSTGTANTVQCKKTAAGLSRDVSYKDITSNSENAVKSETGATILQRKECDAETTAKPESISHTAIVNANTIQKNIQKKGKTSGLPGDMPSEGVESKSEEQRVSKKRITASLNNETVRQADNTKWKIAGRGLPTTKLSLPAIKRKTDPDNLQFVIKKKDNNSSSSTSLAINQKEVEDKVTSLAKDKGVDGTASNDIIISAKTAITERSSLLPDSKLHSSIVMPIIRKKDDTSQKSSKHIVECSFPDSVFFRKVNNNISSALPPLLTTKKNNIPETGIDLKTEIPPIVYSTSDQIHQSSALIWRKSESNTTPSSSSPEQPVHPAKNTMSVSMNSAGNNMLSKSNQGVSSHESVIEANSRENFGNISDQRKVSGSSGIDLSRIADQVSRIIYRKLAVERERRGV